MRDMIDTPELPSAWMRSADYVVRYDFDEASGSLTAAVGGSGYDLTTLTGSDFTSTSNIWEGSQSTRISGSTTSAYYDAYSGATKTAFDAFLETQTGMFYMAFRTTGAELSCNLFQYGTSTTAASADRRSFWAYYSGGKVNLTYGNGTTYTTIQSPWTRDSSTLEVNTEHFITISWKPAISGTANKIDIHFFYAAGPTAGSVVEPHILSGWVRDAHDFGPGSNDLDATIGYNGTTTGLRYHETGFLSFCGEDPTSHCMLKHMWPGASDQLTWEAQATVPAIRVQIEDGDGEWFDLSGSEYVSAAEHKRIDFVQNVTITDDIESPLNPAVLQLCREKYNYSLSPLMADSRLNRNAANSYDPLIAKMRKVRIWYAYKRVFPYPSTTGMTYVTDGPWMLLWEGFVQKISNPGEIMEVICADISVPLNNTLMETAEDWGSSTVDALDAIDDLITNQEPAEGYKGGSISVWERDATTFQIGPVDADSKTVIYELTVLEAVNTVTEAYGAVLQPMYDSQRGTMRYAHYVPERDSPTSAYTFEPETILDIDAFDDDITNLKNKVIVKYATATNDDGSITIATTSNTASITSTSRSEFGTIAGEISSSLITNGTDALALADAVAKDLQDGSQSIGVRTRFMPWVEAGDYFTFTAEDRRFSANQSAAVYKYEHVLSAEELSTAMVLQGKPKGKRRRYGAGSKELLPDTAPPTPVNVAATCTKEFQATITWDAGIASHISTSGVGIKGYMVYGSTTSGFTPGSSNLLGTTDGTSFMAKELAGDDTYYFKIKAVSSYGVVSNASSQASVYVTSGPPDNSVVIEFSASGRSSVGVDSSDSNVLLKSSVFTINVVHDPKSLFNSTTGEFTPPSGRMSVWASAQYDLSSAATSGAVDAYGALEIQLGDGSPITSNLIYAKAKVGGTDNLDLTSSSLPVSASLGEGVAMQIASQPLTTGVQLLIYAGVASYTDLVFSNGLATVVFLEG